MWLPSLQLGKESSFAKLLLETELMCWGLCFHRQCTRCSLRVSLPLHCRLKAVRSFRLLNTPPEPVFDHLTETIATIFKCPFAAMSLLDEDRVYVKSGVGKLSHMPQLLHGLSTSGFPANSPTRDRWASTASGHELHFAAPA